MAKSTRRPAITVDEFMKLSNRNEAEAFIEAVEKLLDEQEEEL